MIEYARACEEDHWQLAAPKIDYSASSYGNRRQSHEKLGSCPQMDKGNVALRHHTHWEGAKRIIRLTYMI